jgi:SAM-dependent methyltransferase
VTVHDGDVIRHHVEAAHRGWQSPEATSAWLDATYRLLLGRAAEDEALRGAWRRLAARPGSRRRLIQEIVDSREFREAVAIEELVESALRGDDWTERARTATDTTERAVEIPWTVSRCGGAARVLDVGTRFAVDFHVTGLLHATAAAEMVASIDLAMVPLGGLSGVRGDVANLPIRDSAFDLITCVSTLEHIGRDNRRYGIETRFGGPEEALLEFARVLAPNGAAIITVPFGVAEDHGWFIQYDLTSWRTLVDESPLVTIEEEIFVADDHGWQPCAPAVAAAVTYGEYTPAAGAVLCARLGLPGRGSR